jgi:hypothetical protein
MKLICSQGDQGDRQQPKLKVVSSKLTTEELNKLDLIASQKGLTRSSYIRSLIFNSLPKQNSQAA